MGRPRKTTNESVNENMEISAKTVETTSGLELVTKVEVGKLTSNAKEYSENLKNELKNFTIERYLDNPDAAKADKAYLNKLKDEVADKRKKATKIWNQPLEEFLAVMTDLEKEIASASNELKVITDKAIEQEKETKKAQIVAFWNTLGFTIVPLERVFNPRWLNKTEKLSVIMEECKAIVEKINSEMVTLKSMQNEDSDILQSFYLETLDLNATLIKGNQLKENRARIKAEEERKAAEMAKKEQFPPIEPSKFNVTETGQVVKENLTTERQPDLSAKGQVLPMSEAPKEPVATFRLEVTAPASKLMALRKFIDENGITYKKL